MPHPARAWDHWCGGKDHFAADRAVTGKLLAVMPELADIARADRKFLGRVVRFLVAEAGVRQFLHIGVGIPSTSHTHHIAQAIDPACRVVYVDHDPVVLAHARALLVSAPEGVVDHLHADLRDPELILTGATATLDLTGPVAVLLLGVVEFVPDDARAYAAVAGLIGALPAGSYLVLAHWTLGGEPTGAETDAIAEAARIWNDSGAPPLRPRTPEAVARFFDGLEILPPGLVPVTRWRPEPDTWCAGQPLGFHGAVARTTTSEPCGTDTGTVVEPSDGDR